jgi:hypothetical protein
MHPTTSYSTAGIKRHREYDSYSHADSNKRYKASPLSSTTRLYLETAATKRLSELPIPITLHILSYIEFSFQNCRDYFSYSYEPSPLLSQISSLEKPLLDLSNPNQLLLNVLSQHQQRKLAQASGMNPVRGSTNYCYEEDDQQMDEEEEYVYFSSDEEEETDAEDEDEELHICTCDGSRLSGYLTDLQQMFIKNGRPLYDIERKGCPACSRDECGEDDEEVLEVPMTDDKIQQTLPVSTSSIIRLLTRSLFGRFTKDVTGKIYCIFTTVNINLVNFPQKPLVKIMDDEERIQVLKHVMVNKRREWELNGSDLATKRSVASDIDLAIRTLSKRHMQLVFQFITKMNRVKHLDVSGLELVDSDICVFVANCLSILQKKGSSNTKERLSIVSLDMSRNHISDEGAKLLCSVSSLEHLCLNTNEISDAGASNLFQMASLKSLLLSNNSISDRAIRSIESNTTLKCLDLSFNMLNEEGIKTLSECKSLNKLHLRYLCLKNEVTKYFANMKNLKTLDLAYNAIGDEGAAILAQNVVLEDLNLGFNYISNAGAYSLFVNKTLKKLSLNNNRISSEGLKPLPFNWTLSDLDLSSNMIDDLGAMIITKSHLKNVNLANNSITLEGARHFLLCPHLKFCLKSQFSRMMSRHPSQQTFQQVFQFPTSTPMTQQLFPNTVQSNARGLF